MTTIRPEDLITGPREWQRRIGKLPVTAVA
jgi:hypothetical protein